MAEHNERQAIPVVQASAFSPSETPIADVTLDALEALYVGLTMRSMARDHTNKMPVGTRDLFTRVGAQIRAAALLALRSDS